MKFNVESVVELRADTVVLRAHSSPTEALRKDLMYSFAGDATKPLVINRLVLVDTAGVERDSASIDPTKWSPVAVGKRAQTIVVTASADYTISKVRLYAGTVLYFEGEVAPVVTVTAGSKVSVTATITASVTLSHSGGTLVSYSVPEEGLDNFIDRFTIGTRRGVKPDKVTLRYGGVTVAETTGTVTVDETAIQVKFHAEYTPDSDVTIDNYDYVLSDGHTLVTVKLEPIVLGAYLTHSWDLAIGF